MKKLILSLWVHKNRNAQPIVSDHSGMTGIVRLVVKKLFGWYHKMHPPQVRLSIFDPQPRILKILEETPFSEIIPLVYSDSEAVHHNGTTP